MPPSEKRIIKASGEEVAWDSEKLSQSLRMSGAEESVVKEITAHVQRDLRDGMHTSDIYEHAFELLKRYSLPVAAQYSIKRAVAQLGPSGFPFERFVAEILKSEGYQTQVGVIMRGACVDHEVDVIAEKSGERILVEAKYHNSPEIKSDVKVALYVHARFEDIKKRFDSEPKNDQLLTRAWLITNTSFTSQAIQYATCSGLALTGWNHPKGHTLPDLIVRTQTHPLTCLTTLTEAHKSTLLSQGIVLCRDIVRDQAPLEAIGLNKARIASVVEEGKNLCPII